MSGIEVGRRLRFGMDLVATLAAATGCVLLVWLNWSKIFPPGPRLPETPILLAGATLKGSSAAPVVLIEFSDYQCPYCAKAETDVLPAVTKQYIDAGTVQLAFRHHPLQQLHPGATQAAEAALCAGRQGKFWEMHAALFEDQKNMNEASLIARSQKLALNDEAFRACLAGAVIDRVRADAREAEALGLTGTPAFLVGRREPDGRVRISAVLKGAQSVREFEKAISQALQAESATRPLVAAGAAALVLAVWFGVKRRSITDKSTGKVEEVSL